MSLNFKKKHQNSLPNLSLSPPFFQAWCFFVFPTTKKPWCKFDPNTHPQLRSIHRRIKLPRLQGQECRIGRNTQLRLRIDGQTFVDATGHRGHLPEVQLEGGRWETGDGRLPMPVNHRHFEWWPFCLLGGRRVCTCFFFGRCFFYFCWMNKKQGGVCVCVCVCFFGVGGLQLFLHLMMMMMMMMRRRRSYDDLWWWRWWS